MSPRQVRRVDRPVVGSPSQNTRSVNKPKRPNFKLSLKRGLLVVALIATGVLVWFGGRIQKVVISDSAQSQAAAELVEQTLRSPWWRPNILWLSTTALEQELLAKYPDQLADVQIQKQWLTRAIKVSAVKRQPVLRWQTSQGSYGVDPQGVVAAQLSGGEGAKWPLVIDSTNLDVKAGQPVAPARFVEFVSQVFSRLKPTTGLSYRQARVTETTNELLVDTDRGYYLRLDSTRSTEEQLAALKILLAHKVNPTQYIDLRLPQKAYYR